MAINKLFNVLKKTIMKILTNLKLVATPVLILLCLATIFTSCLKRNEETPIPSISGLSIIHASPTIEKLDVYISQTKANSSDFSFTNKIDYLNAYSGSRQISIKKKDASAILKSENFVLKPQTGYSLFVIEKLDNIGFLFLTDTLTNPPAGKAKIRFVNLSPDAGALNLAIDGISGDLVSDKLFKENSAFKTINPADRVTFLIKNKATGTVEATLANVKIEKGNIYTLWAKGLKSASGDFAFGASIFTHK